MNKAKTKSFLVGALLLLAGMLTGQAQIIQTGLATVVSGSIMQDGE